MREHDAQIERAFREARCALPDVDLPQLIFVASLERHRREEEPLEQWLTNLRAPDLFLAAACAHGDAAAVRHLERSFLSRIDATVRRLDPSPAFIDEVRQQLRLHLLLPRREHPPRIAEYSGRGSLMSWIQVTAARTAIDLKRSGGIELISIPSSLAADSDPEVEHFRTRYGSELQAAFQEAIAALSTRQRNVLRMHFLDGAPLDSLATIYRVHRTTIGRWVQQACDQVLSATKRRLGAKLHLPAGAMDSLVSLLDSRIDFSASLLTDSFPAELG